MWHSFKRSNWGGCIYRIVTSPIFRTIRSKICQHFWHCIWMTIHWMRYAIALANLHWIPNKIDLFPFICPQSMNVNALKYLVNLRTFNIPKIDRKIAGKICEQLESLDIMHLTSETFDLSCFELSSGSTFDDSTIRIGQTTLSFLENDSDGKALHFTFIPMVFWLNYLLFYLDLYKKPTNPPPPPPPEPTVLAITETTVGAPQKGSKNIGPKVSSQKMSQISQNETQVESVGSQLSGSEQPKDVVQEATVDVPIEMIYLILIGKEGKEPEWP